MTERRVKPRVTKAERRRLILGAARRLFAAGGYAAATPEGVAAAADVTPAALAKLFPDRAALLAGVVAELHAGLFAVTAAAGSSSSQLNALIDAFRAQVGATDSPARVLLALLAEGDAEARAVLVAALAPTVQALAELVRRGQQEGVFRRTLEPARAAWELLRALFGQALLAGVEPAAPAEPEHPEQHPPGFDVLLHGLLKLDV